MATDRCDICGRVFPAAALIYDEGHFICELCCNMIGTCNLCKSVSTCTFKTDPTPIPPIVTKVVRQGNMEMQVQVKNPEREAITCHKCGCWNDAEKCCNREFGTCANHDSVY